MAIQNKDIPRTENSDYRTKPGLGIWEGRGKVVAVGVGHSPTARRWDGTAENSIGAWSILAIRRAIADAGVDPATIDGIVIDSHTTTGAHWPAEREIPMDVVNQFKVSTDEQGGREVSPLLDGIAQNAIPWILNNMPELTGIKFMKYGDICVSKTFITAGQAIADGKCSTTIVLKGWHNLDGRYYQGGANAQDTIAGPAKWTNPWAGPASLGTALQFQRYMMKYGKTHEMMAPAMRQWRHNGLNFPEGYWAQHRPEELEPDDYINARWIAKPANLFDNDIPIMAAAAYILTTPERAKGMKQKPVYMLNHYTDRMPVRGLAAAPTLEECQTSTANVGRGLMEGAGLKATELSFENMYDGFSLFHVFHLEGLGFHGIKEGEALDWFQGDISPTGPNPISPSGGNVGSGRTRFWNWTDCIQQIQGRAGGRQVPGAKFGTSGGPMPTGGDFAVWGGEIPS